MIQAVDEILDGNAKFRIKDENGNILYDNLSIELITPATQSGTPLNKALFDSIHSHLLFNGRYVTLAGVSPSDYTMPYLSGSSHTGYTVNWSYSSSGVSGRPSTAYDMFNETKSTTVIINPSATATPERNLTLEIIFPNYINMMTLSGYGHNYVNDQKIRISGRATTSGDYEIINTYTNPSASGITINSNKLYKYIKIEFISSTTTSMSVDNTLRITGKTASISKTEAVNYKIVGEQLLAGQILHVRTQSSYIMYDNLIYRIQATDTQQVNLPKTLEPNGFYELYYNGTEFIKIGG